MVPPRGNSSGREPGMVPPRGDLGGHHGGGYHQGGKYYGGRYYSGFRGYGYGGGFNQFYLGPGGFGYTYFGNGFGLSIGLPLNRFYDAYPYYANYTVAQPYFVESFPQPVYTEYLPADAIPIEGPVENVGIVETGLVTPPEAPLENFDGPSVIPATGIASEYQAAAEQAFLENRYEDAIRQSTHAIIEDAENGKLHLFASQVFFALGDYRASAAAVQRGASLLDRSEWGYVVENYKQFYRGKDYVNQMDALVQFTKENPELPFVHFLRGYHYKYLGYDEAARAPLLRAIELESQDRLAAELLVMAGGQVPESAKPVNPAPETAKPVDPTPDPSEAKQNPTTDEESETPENKPASVKPDEKPPVVLTPSEALKKETTLNAPTPAEKKPVEKEADTPDSPAKSKGD